MHTAQSRVAATAGVRHRIKPSNARVGEPVHAERVLERVHALLVELAALQPSRTAKEHANAGAAPAASRTAADNRHGGGAARKDLSRREPAALSCTRHDQSVHQPRRARVQPRLSGHAALGYRPSAA